MKIVLLRRSALAASALAAIAAMTALVSGPARAASSDPDALRAAVTFNIIRYVAFPEPASRQPIDLCLIRGVSGARHLAGLNGRAVGNRPLAVRQTGLEETGACEIVFVAQAAEIPRVARRGVLVIGDGAAVLGAGGTVGLVRMGGQTRFEVNARAARGAGVTISSRLLRLASRVQQ